MGRLIDADIMLSDFEERCAIVQERNKDCCISLTPDAVIGFIKEQPTVDAAPVVYGEWDEDGKCTVCGTHAPFWCLASTYYKSCYCPNCGAKMDGGKR